MYVPVQIKMGAGGGTQTLYDRELDLTVRQLTAFDKATGDMTEPLTGIGRDLHTSVGVQFATEGAGGATGPWQPLSEVYGDWKSQRSSAPLLVGLRPLHKGTREHPTRPESYAPSGKMRRELLDPFAMHVSPRRLLYAPTSDIAGYHETGTSKMPARPPVDLTVGFLHSIDRAFAMWIDKLVKEYEL